MDITMLREREDHGAFTVSELNVYIKNLFESNRTLSSVTVKGEISNFTAHRSGHLYFSLKDADGQIRSVMFRSSAARLKFMPESGMKVIAHGSVTVFPRDGSYQLYVSSLQPDGIGALYLAYEQLKERLYAEGLFDSAHKCEIPRFPKRIGVITSPTGAAVRDIINVTGRRYPLADVFVYPALVQGDGAEESLIKALDYFDKSRLVDVIVIGRGGGSIEDLWAFNGESLARRIYSAEIPIISAVGHETDFTICDFVADMRAPTPSAAAELATPDIRELALRADNLFERAQNAALSRLSYESERLKRMRDSSVLSSAHGFIDGRRGEVERLSSESLFVMNAVLQKARSRLSVCAEKAVAMNPLAVLARGYSVTEKDGKILGSADSVSVGDDLKIRLHEGEISARVVSVSRESDNP
jgi:exodeoxyribonuclease VII large subunit